LPRLAPTDRPRLVLLLTSAAVFLAYVDVSVVNVALPQVAHSLGTSQRAASWAITVYNVTFTSLLVTAGRVADVRGRRRIFVGGLLTFGWGSLLCALAWTLPALIGFRVVQGIGAAVLVPVSLALLLPLWPRERRGLAIGLWGTAGALGSSLGPPLGGILTTVSWRLVFLINVPIALLVAWAVPRIIEETKVRSNAHIDGGGVAVLAVGIAALALGVTQGPAWGWTSPAVVGLFAIALLMVPAMAVLERRAPEPILDLRLFRIRSFAVGTLASTLFYFAFLAYSITAVLFLEGAWGYSPAAAGLAYSAGPAISAATNVIGGRLVDRHGSRAVATGGLAMLAVAIAVMAFLVAGADQPDYVRLYLPPALLAGVAMSMIFPALTAVSTKDLAADAFATGTGVLGTLRQMGGALGIASAVAITGGASVGEVAYRHAFALQLVVVVLAMVAVAGLRRHRAESQ
jgi:EmrB/QacA subfamily drug resistance transporter